jgi:hypothetical protein
MFCAGHIELPCLLLLLLIILVLLLLLLQRTHNSVLLDGPMLSCKPAFSLHAEPHT